MGYLPSKKFIVLIATVVALFGGVLVILGAFGTGTASVEKNADSSPEAIRETPLDTDGDGLKNWEERLMGTDEGGIDTDGDGTNDGDEIRERRNPLIVPPDAIEVPDILQNGEGDSPSASVTEAFAREFLSVLLLQKENETAEGTLGETFSSLFEDIALLPAPEYYMRESIRTVPGNAGALRMYGNAVMGSVKRHAGANSKDTFAAFQKILAGVDASAGKEALASIEKEYERLANDLASHGVPEGLLDVHLDVINGIRTLGESVHDLAFAEKDPLRASIGLSTYLKYLDRETLLFSEIRKTFQETNVTFTAEENGAAWNNF